MNNRAYALDALRGYAIITMVLSATIVTQVLPGWMSHAQTPPPDHIFNPSLPGITWVDLVFPFFLFAMGAAFPFSIGKRAEKGDSKLKLTTDFLCHLHSAFLSVCVEFSAGHQSLAAGYSLLCGSVSDVHAHSFENAGLGTYRHKDSRIRNCGNHDAYYFLCRWKNVQSVF